MGSIVARVKALELPSNEFVVIGSGLLDALDLREASDIDLVASKSLFDTLQSGGQFRHEVRRSVHDVLLAPDVEIWRDWGKSYEAIARQALSVEGIRFAAPELIIEKKRERGTEKDLRDIKLLEEYLNA